MQYYITGTFARQFSCIAPEKMFDVFMHQLKMTKLIHLDERFHKFKFKVGNNCLRGVVFTSGDACFPIFIVKKNNKKYGSNLILTKQITNILETKLSKAYDDFEHNRYVLY